MDRRADRARGTMRLSHLETFVVLARLRNFSRTAAQLNTTQPAISARIGALESDLGVRLIERAGRHFHLTPAGEETLRAAEKILADYADLRLRLSNPHGLRGTVRIGAIDAIVQTWLPRFVESIRHAHPQVEIEVIADTTVSLIAAMRQGDLDMAVCMEPVLEEGYRNFVVCTYAMSWVGSPSKIDPARVYTTADLAAMPLITFQRNSPPYRMIAPYFQDESVLASQLNTSNSLPTMIRLAIDGFGIAAIPTVVIQREIAEGQLAVLRVSKPFPPLSFIASYHTGPGTTLEPVIELARQAVTSFCGEVDPALAWV